MNCPLARVAPAIAGALALVLLPAVTASAATTLTVSPHTGVAGGQDITIVASGLPASAGAGWCEGVLTGAANLGDCGDNTVVAQVTDGTGTIGGVVRLQRFIHVPNLARWVDCADATETCVMAAAVATQIPATLASVPLSFAAVPEPPTSRGTIELTADADRLLVVGVGFRPGAAIDVHQCATGADRPSGCGFAKATTIADANGGFQTTVTADSVVSPAGGAAVDCLPLEAQACSILAAEAVDFPGTHVGAPLLAPVPRVVPSSTTQAEDDAGTTVIEVPVALSHPTTQTVTVQWNTVQVADDRPVWADPVTDYAPAGGTVTFAAGQMTAVVLIPVNGDTTVEPDEYIVVSFHDATNATMGGFWGLGIGVITNDD
jgi:hypothetical protein